MGKKWRSSKGAWTATIEGIADARHSLSSFIKALETKPTEILLEEAPRVQEHAHMLTPLRSGDLRSNVTVTVARDRRNPGLVAHASSIHRGYDYAYIQHENLDYHHNVGQAKYLETAYVEGVERIERRLREEVTYD